MKEVLGWVNFGRLLPPKVGHYCTPIYTLFAFPGIKSHYFLAGQSILI